MNRYIRDAGFALFRTKHLATCSSPWSCIARDIDSGDSERRRFGNQIAEGGPIKIGEPADVGHTAWLPSL